MKQAVLAAAAGAALAALTSTPVHAQGFGVYEHGTCAMGRAGTGVAAPCPDGSAMFSNPAGLIGRTGWDITFGVTTIDAGGAFINDTTGNRTGLANAIIPVPHGFVRYGLNDRLAVGLGMFVPYGLGTKWPETFEGRFSGYDNDLRSIYVQPTVAFSPVPGIQIGGGVDFVLSKVKLTQRLDLFEQAVPGVPGAIIGQLGIPRNTEFADAALESENATGIGAHVGITVELHERVSVGARYLSQVSLDYEGTVDFTQIPTGIILPDGTVFGAPGPLPVDTVVAGLMAPGGVLADQDLTTSITMPAQFVAGFAVKLLDNLTFLADYQLTRWSVFDTLTLDFANGGSETLVEDYDDTNGFRTGLDWRPGTGGTIRIGYLWHEAAAPAATVTPLLPEGTRNEVTFGYGFRLSDGFGVDAAYQYIRQNDRRGRMRSPLAGEDPLDLNAGLYQFRAHLFGVTVNLSF